MNFDELLSKLMDLPDPDEDWEKGALKVSFAAASLKDLKAIARGEVPEELSGEQASEVAVHAYRVIAERGEVEEIPFFVGLLGIWDETYVRDVLIEEFPWVMAEMGGGVVVPALEILRDDMIQEVDRGFVVEGLENMAEEGVKAQEIYRGFAAYLHELRPERHLNGLLIGPLIDRCPGKFHEEILAAYEANVVDVSINGDREEVEIELGLRKVRETEKRHYMELENELALRYRRDQLGEFPEKGDAYERADYFIHLYSREGGAPNAIVLDGIYAAVICSPVMVRPTALFFLPWDMENASPDKAVEFASEEDHQRAMDALKDFYNEINTGINELNYVPSIPFRSEEEGESLLYPEPWLLGLMMGASYLSNEQGESDYSRQIAEMSIERLKRLEEGETFDVKSVSDLISPVIEALLLARHQDGKSSTGSPPVGTGYSREPVVREDLKVGRNDPCPCGSGRKYKKCCAN